ncbi:hypothetical protein WOSG25_110810 [Weissella oryzae SG25]|uniref:Uncharacterized protein n=1 Tax=Weissella oryzae (strain DSM 25784 / JCM 18191 / LMG 30913 / SG25) TaxID=1329250 RepID=A0A069CWJ5_WEIOS|nr:hypothetical protein [Weissella oryzae]GAK31603.1 hypothetical protein WOSG25_110810 [Weissella oryzae SG25]
MFKPTNFPEERIETFEQKVRSIRLEKHREEQNSESTSALLRKQFQLSELEIELFEKINGRETFDKLKEILQSNLSNEKIPVLSLQKITKELLEVNNNSEIKLSDSQKMKTIWAYIVLTLPKLDVLIIGPKHFFEIQEQEQEYTFRVAFKSDLRTGSQKIKLLIYWLILFGLLYLGFKQEGF